MKPFILLIYSAQHAQLVYQENRKRSVRPIRQRKQDREAIEHYMRQNYSPEMMVKAREFKSLYLPSITGFIMGN
ncbi:putative transposase [Streptococcus dysgalactiae subsp. equisimilis 167]|nr:putative transposase [Streptococcus dysgalactiae subsp. equisimilis 167]